MEGGSPYCSFFNNNWKRTSFSIIHVEKSQKFNEKKLINNCKNDDFEIVFLLKFWNFSINNIIRSQTKINKKYFTYIIIFISVKWLGKYFLLIFVWLRIILLIEKFQNFKKIKFQNPHFCNYLWVSFRRIFAIFREENDQLVQSQ